ncbi:MAG: NUDIX hydrolase [Acidimicrobiia bacterium]
MTPGRHRVWDGAAFVEVAVPVSGPDGVVVPVIRVVVTDRSGGSVVLQRRDGAGESVRGLLEIPGGRWRAGESPTETAIREVREETGLDLVSVDGVTVEELDAHRVMATIRPLAVVAGAAAAFPAAHLVLTGIGEGSIRPEAGATTDVRWWPLPDLRCAVSEHREWFVPSSHAALVAYLDRLDSTA